jgi:hypothetical protein
MHSYHIAACHAAAAKARLSSASTAPAVKQEGGCYQQRTMVAVNLQSADGVITGKRPSRATNQDDELLQDTVKALLLDAGIVDKDGKKNIDKLKQGSPAEIIMRFQEVEMVLVLVGQLCVHALD